MFISLSLALAPGYNPEQDPPRRTPAELRAILDGLGIRSGGVCFLPDAELERARSRVMPFGRYEGKTLDLIPLSYLHWVISGGSYLSINLREAIRLVLSGGNRWP